MTPALPRMVGINHVALEVGDLEAALEFYGAIFALTDIDREPGIAFIDMGDQFLALNEVHDRPRDEVRHFGLVVDDKPAVRATLEAHGVEILPGPRLDFLDPWGQPDPSGRLPRHPVHQGFVCPARHGPRAAAQARPGHRGAACKGLVDATTAG